MQTATPAIEQWAISQSKSEQVDSPEKLLKTMVGAIAIKDRIDGEVFHPDGVIVDTRLAAI